MGTKIYGSRSELTNIKFRTSGDSKEVAVQPPTSLGGASNTLTTPNISGTSDTLISRVSVDTGSNALKNKDLESTTITVVDATDNTKKLLFDLTGISTATTRTLTIPNASTTIVGTDVAQTLTNKTIAAGSNTISGITDTNIASGAAITRTKLASGTAGHVLINDGSGVMSSELTLSKVRGGTGADNSSVTFPSSGVVVTEAGTSTLTNKTIDAASNTVSNIANANIAAAAAIDRTKLASGTADHVIINNASGVLSSEAALAKVRGGTGIDNSSVTFPSTGVIVTEAGTQTLTNKTLTSPTISTPSVSSPTVSGTLLLQNAAGAQPVLSLSEDPDNGTNKLNIQAAANMTADYTLTMPSVVASSGQVLTATDGTGTLGWTSPLTNPMTTQGDIIVGGASGAATRLAHPGAAGQALMTDTTTTQAWTGSPSFSGSVTAATGMTVTSGVLNLSGSGAGQISFPATQNASANANTLDDYEEGTWTPAFTSTGSFTYTVQSGYYTKIGIHVFASARIDYSAVSGNSGDLKTNLPFSASTATNGRYSGSISNPSALGNSVDNFWCNVAANDAANVNYYRQTASTVVNYNSAGLAASGSLYYTVHYRV